MHAADLSTSSTMLSEELQEDIGINTSVACDIQLIFLNGLLSFAKFTGDPLTVTADTTSEEDKFGRVLLGVSVSLLCITEDVSVKAGGKRLVISATGLWFLGVSTALTTDGPFSLPEFTGAGLDVAA